ncbi:hypothetical protein SAY87_019877 [Trapa incisa]|uniref:Uncharacterized protein n=1 Tax=Trapa incisa TaxID=236973 RepID=A0AAN7K2L0_9MYRT|nr:hypothetical protein SAY87_019877 [Trapa incisa]
MGRAPCCSKVGLRRGPWTLTEDKLLINYIQTRGEGHWRSMPKKAGLLRCGKSCRLRWMNYLRPGIKRGNITTDEEDLIIRMHSLIGNRWSIIARRLPGRTDNEIKNYWNSHLRKRNTGANSDKAVKEERLSKKTRKNETAGKKPYSKAPKNPTRTKIKVHQPKAVRISTSFSDLAAGNILRTTLNVEDMLVGSGCSILTPSDPNWNDGSMDHFFLPGSTSSNKEVLDKMFEEYEGVLMAEDHRQTTEMESFLDSPWI